MTSMMDTQFRMAGADIPSYSTPSSVDMGAYAIGTQATASPALPGNQMSGLERGAMIGSLIGEGLHGVGNVVRAFKGQAPVRYAGKTVSDMFAKKRADAQRDKLFEMFLGEGEKTPGEKAQQSAEVAGSDVATASDPEPAPMQVEVQEVPGVERNETTDEKDRLIMESMKKRGDTGTLAAGTGVSFEVLDLPSRFSTPLPAIN